MDKRQNKKHKSKMKKTLTIIVVIIGLLIVGGGVYAYSIYDSLHATADKVYKPLKTTKNSPLKEEKSDSPSINILLLGVDERSGDKGRSDTMIVATLNPKTKSMQMISIPRDTRVQIPGQSGYSKVNAAYAYGGEELAVQTVEKYLNINISYYVKMNFNGLSDLVDAVDGVTVNNDIDWIDSNTGYHYAKGELHLDGIHALAYARMRHQDNRGDFGRNLRQRQIIQAVINKGTNFTNVTKINAILEALGHNVTTNLTFDDMKRLATDYRDCRQNIINYETKGTPKYMDGVSWVIVTEQEFQNVHDMVMKEFEAKKS